MKTFTVNLNINRPNEEVDVVINQTGEFTSQNIKSAVVALQGTVQNLANESPETVIQVSISVNSDSGSSGILSINGTKAEVDEFISTVQVAFSEETTTTTEQVTEETTTPPINPNPGPQGEVA